MSRFICRALLGCAAPAALMTGIAHAQDAAPASAAQSGLGDIIVTARKRAESLQDVPTAVTAMDAKLIADLQIESFQDVGKTAPNVMIQKQAGSPTAPQFNIRGVSSGSINFQIDSGVALYVDGVYLGRPGNSAFDLADIERIEVLRGPQGTLFGRNSTGGAISFVTAGPTGKFGVIADATIGNYQRRRGRITVNTPEWHGLSARITYAHDENTGYVKNSGPRRTYLFPEPFGPQTSADSFGANNNESIFAAVRYAGIDGLTVDYRFDYADLVTTLDAMQLLHGGAAFSGITNFPNQPALGGTAVESLKRLDRVPIDGLAPATQKTWGHSLTAVYDLNDAISVKYIGALRGFKVNSSSDLDGNALVDPYGGTGGYFQALAAVRYAKQRQWSHELQLLGHMDRLDFVGGLFYYREKAFLNSPVIFGLVAQPGQAIPIVNPDSYLAGGDLLKVLNKSYAAYAHVDYRLTDELEISGGTRYSKDDRTENDLLAAPRTPTVPRGSFNAKQGRFDYDASVRYKFAQDSSVYAKFTTGFVSGGIFHGAEFEPETIKSYEAGVKSEFLDRRVRLNVAVFQADRKALQVTGFDPNQGGNILLNTGTERARGVEVESTFVPVDGLTLTANYGFTDVKPKAESSNPLATAVRSYQPRHTAYLAAFYEAPEFSDGTKMSFRIDGQYEGKHYRLQCPIGSLQSPTEGCLGAGDAALDRQLIIPASWEIGTRLTFADIPLGNVKGRISLWGKNLNNSDKPEFLFPVFDTWAVGTFQAPRTYGVDFGIEF